MLSRTVVFVGMVLSAAAAHAQPADVTLVFMQQGEDCRLVLSPKYLAVDLNLHQIGVFYWDVEYYCDAQKSLHIDQDLTAAQPCWFCDLEIAQLAPQNRVPNQIPSYAAGAFGYRVRLCDPNTTNNCVEHDPEVEVRRPPTFDGTVRVALSEHNGRCTAQGPPAVRLTHSHAVISWLVQNGCSQSVRAEARRVASVGGETSGPCSRSIEVPAGGNGRVACLLPAWRKPDAAAETTIGFDLVLDKPIPSTALGLRASLLDSP